MENYVIFTAKNGNFCKNRNKHELFDNLPANSGVYPLSPYSGAEKPPKEVRLVICEAVKEGFNLRSH
jgi:hypothetical protein